MKKRRNRADAIKVNVSGRVYQQVILVGSLLALWVVFPSIGGSTEPKLITFTYLGSLIILYALKLTSTRNTVLVFCLFWIALLIGYASTFGYKSLNSILFGYVERNLGLLALLIFFAFFVHGMIVYKSVNVVATFISYTGGLISVSIVFSQNFRSDELSVNQFSYPKEGAINSNVVCLYLVFTLISSIYLVINSIKNGMHFKIAKSLFILLTSGYALATLGNIQSYALLFLAILISYIYRFYERSLNLTRIFSLAFIMPAISVIYYVVMQYTDLQKVTADLSIIERQKIFQISLVEIRRHFVLFRMPDTTADLGLGRIYRPGSNVIIDNAHNVYFEIGLHFGWFFALLSFMTTMLFYIISTYFLIAKSESPEKTQLLLMLNTIGTVSLNFTILHPITLVIYGLVYGCIWQEIRLNVYQHIVPKNLDSRSYKKVLVFHSNSFELIRMFTTLLVVGVVISNLFSLTLSSYRRFEYLKTERELFQSSDGAYEFVLDLSQKAEELGDRKYLSYTGRQLFSLLSSPVKIPLSPTSVLNSPFGRKYCELARSNIETQRNLGFNDLNLEFLERSVGTYCP